MPALKREKNTTVSIHQKEDFLTRMLKTATRKKENHMAVGSIKNDMKHISGGKKESATKNVLTLVIVHQRSAGLHAYVGTFYHPRNKSNHLAAVAMKGRRGCF